MSKKRNANQIRRLIERFGDHCHYCSCVLIGSHHEEHNSRTRDHVVPKVMGGLAVYENFVLACKSCNSRRGDNLFYCRCDHCSSVVEEFFMKHFGNVPERAKVWKHRGQWVVSYGAQSFYVKSWEDAMRRVPVRIKV